MLYCGEVSCKCAHLLLLRNNCFAVLFLDLMLAFNATESF